MNLNQRIEILIKLGEYLSSDAPLWVAAREKATRENGWFVPQFVQLATQNIVNEFLQPDALCSFVQGYPAIKIDPVGKNLGIVMAGNIPMVGFHDFMCGFLCGFNLLIKTSSKDDVLIRHLAETIISWAPELAVTIQFADRLKGCDAYIATGSNNSGRYFEYYFRNYPSIIRKNRTSVSVITGEESTDTLEKLGDDLMLYFGLGCRNVSKLYVPRHYDFQPLLKSLDKYNWMADHNKFKNNYDYNLALHILNNKFYMTNGTLLLVESESIFSPISQVHYEFYDQQPPTDLGQRFGEEIQCVTGFGGLPHGQAQHPAINDFADGADTMAFLTNL